MAFPVPQLKYFPNPAGMGVQVPAYQPQSTDFYSSLLPAAGLNPIGLGLTGVGLLGSLLTQNQPQALQYERSAGLEMAIDQLMALPGFRESLTTLGRGTTARLGQARREGAREIEGTMADPAQVAKFITELYANTASAATQQGAVNYQTAFQGGLQKSGTLGNLSLSEQQQQQQLQMFNEKQRMNNNPLGDLFGTVGQIGAYMI